MIKKITTVKDATYEWVQTFNAFPENMIEKLMDLEYTEWQEVTVPQVGKRVIVFDYGQGEVVEVYYEEGIRKFAVELDDPDENDGEEIIVVDEDGIEAEGYGYLPMWGTMWQFSDSIDEYWLENQDGINLMSACGFKIFKHEEWGYFFGIDGAGYDFYEAHWIPLYKARGMKWHAEE